jgi:hypothetical protein
MLGDHPDDGRNKHFRNVGKLLPEYMAQQPRSQSPSSVKLRSILRNYFVDWIKVAEDV